jgi:uncharacterized protein YdaU (DUF1376 family)
VKIRRIDFSPDEWIAGTVELSNEERGMYITACALIYSRDGPIEIEALRAVCPGDLRPFKRILERLVSLGKIQRSGSQLSQKRCLSELENCRKRSLSSVENGRKGGRPPNEINNIENPRLSPSRARNHQPSTINHQETPHTPRKRGGSLEGFEEWWKGYPQKVGKGAAERAWSRALALASREELIAGVARYLAAPKPPDREWCHPATWLNQKRWLDEPASATGDLPNGKVAGPDGPPPSVEELLELIHRREMGMAR